MAAALGGKAAPKAALALCKATDVIVGVKRIDPQTLDNIKRSGKPWVWDLVDFYPQPACTKWRREEAIAWVHKVIQNVQPKPVAIVWPNQRMMEDCNKIALKLGIKNYVLYHHYRPGLIGSAVSPTLRLLGYEGSPNYIRPLIPKIQEACAKADVEFVVNPTRIDQCDAVLAMRCPETNGYVQRHWKSNVKLANAHAAGLPFIAQKESGYTETCCGHERWVVEPEQIVDALAEFSSMQKRELVQKESLRHSYPLNAAATELRALLAEAV